MGLCCMTHRTQTGALGQPRGMGWGRKWEAGAGGRGHVYPWVIHVDAWQTPTQYCNHPSIKKKKRKHQRASKVHMETGNQNEAMCEPQN